MATGKLTDIRVKQAKFTEKPKKLSDGGGMYLLVDQSGKYWRLNYRFGGKQKTLALGVYPTVSLKAARDKRDEAKRQLDKGLNPSTLKKRAKVARVEAVTNTFEAIGREWYGKKSTGCQGGA